MGKLFGTDGVRGVANTELSCELAMSIGKAAAMVLTDDTSGRKPTILIGKDTRLSSDMLEGALTAGLCSVGANVVHLGTVPTPAVAYLVRKYSASAGVMISASHNPHEFNGIKIFSGEGYKLPDALEDKIEAIVLDNAVPYPTPIGKELGSVSVLSNAIDEYIDHIAGSISSSLEGVKVAVDCSNGSASTTAKKLFTKLGADFEIINDTPNGVNINENCGSTHMESLIAHVKKGGFDCGVAFDGDADRCLAVDENGEIVDGDFIMAVCANEMKKSGTLSKSAVVGTVMTNMGFNAFCEQQGISFVAANVGDRYVLEEMLEKGYNLGGEQSGHVIFLDYGTTGDGQLTAVQLLSILKSCGKSLSQLAAVMKRFPQVLINVTVSSEKKSGYDDNTTIAEKVADVRKQLGSRGRILVRPSGTEPLIRVMLEGENTDEITRLAEETADTIKSCLC